MGAAPWSDVETAQAWLAKSIERALFSATSPVTPAPLSIDEKLRRARGEHEAWLDRLRERFDLGFTYYPVEHSRPWTFDDPVGDVARAWFIRGVRR